MPEFAVYNSDGVKVEDETTFSEDRVSERCSENVLLSVEPHDRRVELSIKTKSESGDGWLYMVVEDDEWTKPIRNAGSTASDWMENSTYEMDFHSDSMFVYRSIVDFDLAQKPDNSEMELICYDLLAHLEPQIVKVPSGELAVGLLSLVGGGDRSIVISDADINQPVDDFDLTINIDREYSKILPGEVSVLRWNEFAEKYNSIDEIDVEENDTLRDIVSDEDTSDSSSEDASEDAFDEESESDTQSPNSDSNDSNMEVQSGDGGNEDYEESSQEGETENGDDSDEGESDGFFFRNPIK